MAYGTVKVDNIVFDDGGSDQTVTVSGLYNSLTSGITVTGTISGDVVIGGTSVSGTTVAGVTVTGTTVQGASGTFTSLTGTTIQGTTATYTTGSFTSLTGTTIQGTTATYTTGSFTSLTGTTTTGTTANFVSGVFTTSVSGTTVIAPTGTFTSLTGTTTQGTTATYTTGSFTSLTGTTTTGTTSSFTSGVFTTLSGATATFTSGIIAAGTAAAPSLAILGDPNTGIFSPGADQVAVATNGVQRLTTDTAAVTSTLPVVHPLGAVGTPSITFTGDLNTGFWSPTADTLAASTAGSERLRVTSTGNVGIRTSSPAGLLHANTTNGNVSYFGGPIGITNGNYTGIQIGYTELNGTFAKSMIVQEQTGDGNARGKIHILNNNQATAASATLADARLTITSAGNVGIRTSSPAGLLHANTTNGNVSYFGGPIGITNGNYTGIQIGYTELNGTFAKSMIVQEQTGDGNARGKIHILNNNTGSAASATLADARLTITPAGLVGIGTTSPATTLDVNGDVTITDKIIHGGDTNTAIRFPAADTVSVETNGSERARIDSSGRLLVGTSTSRGNTFNGTGNDCALQIEGNTFGSSSASFIRNTNNDAAPFVVLGKSRGTAVGSTTVVNSGDNVGAISFQGSDGTELVEAARITAEVDGTPGANDMPGRLVFSTTADGSASPTERLRINNVGQTMVNSAGTASAPVISKVDDPNTGIFFPAADTIAFAEGGSEAARVDSSGRLLVGTSTASATNELVSIRGDSPIVILRASSNSPGLRFYDSNDTAVESCQINYYDNTAFSIETIPALPIQFKTSNVTRMTIASDGAVNVVGALSKGSGSFRIDHPLPEKKDTHQLVHSFIEGPQADLIYRGHVFLKNGKADVNIDEAARITEGTFEALCRDVCCFTSNETDWTPVRGHVDGNILTIEAQDPTSTAEVCWMVIGERKDQHMLDTTWTDENGRVITEPMKEIVAPEAA